LTPLHVSCAVQGGYVAHSAAMLRSVLAHRGGHELVVHYLHGPTLPRRDGKRLERMVHRGGGELRLHEIADDRVAALPAAGYFTAAMWYRIFLPELVPEADRVLYLDVDTIAVDALAPLWDVDLSRAWLGAVTNVFEPWHAGRPAALGLAGPDVYFNSGVLLLNLEELRRDRCTGALYDFAVEHAAELQWPDQDALNVVLGARRVALHPRWNAMNSVMLFDSAADVFGAEAVREARARPAIRHFEGPSINKPWHLECTRPHRGAYRRHRLRTPWPLYRPDGLSVRGLARRALRRPHPSG
jgi:lipopolysaccharide biosynthesis glycosyltransferase